MHIEFEERILEIDKEKMISKLESFGAEKQGEWFQKRYLYRYLWYKCKRAKRFEILKKRQLFCSK